MFGKLIRQVTGDAAAEIRAKAAADDKAEEAVRWGIFVEYHNNSPWAQAKAAAGGRLSDEAVQYMQREIETRKDQERRFLEFMEKENAQHGTQVPAADAAANGNAVPAVLRGEEGDAGQAAGVVRGEQDSTNAGAIGSDSTST